MDKIDFVILWVDGNDKDWLKEKNIYTQSNNLANSINRYRDWDNLKYWFRGVEKFAPWVNNIYFITYGHLPSWLNYNHDKIKIIKHKDYIPDKYLPTYNSNVIELNLNRIDSLSEKFVLFNDDMFIIRNVEKEDFFKNDLPCDECVHNLIIPNGNDDVFNSTLFNNIRIVNKNFNKRKVIKQNFNKIFNIKYGLGNIRTLLLLPWKDHTGFFNPHLPQSFLKSSYNELWEKEKNILEKTSSNRFRSNNDVTQYLVRYIQLSKGKFIPRHNRIGKYFEITNENTNIKEHILKQKTKLICINDSDPSIKFEDAKVEINEVFNKILPEKCSFEI